MSSTNRSDIRHPDDFYKTEAWVTRSILPRLGIYDGARILDIGCGDGAIGRVIREMYPNTVIDGVELDEARAQLASGTGAFDAVYVSDFLTWAPGHSHYDFSVTNPPFSLAKPIIERALGFVSTATFLLRQNFLASKERIEFHRKHPSDLYILPKRPSFARVLTCPAKGCGFKVLLPLDASYSRVCPRCAGEVNMSTSDSTEYAWFTYGSGRGNRWFHLDLPEAA